MGGVGNSGPVEAAGFSGGSDVVTGIEDACEAEAGCAYAGDAVAAFATAGRTLAGSAAGADAAGARPAADCAGEAPLRSWSTVITLE